MVPMTPEKLRAITAAAIASAQRKLSARKDAIFRSAMRQLKVEVAAGRRFAIAMSLKRGDDYASDAKSRKSLSPKELIGVAALIFEQCKVFEPTIEHWSKEVYYQRDGNGTEEGFNIVLHWGDVHDLLAKVSSLGEESIAGEIRKAILAAQKDIDDKAAAILGQLEARAITQANSGKNWAIAMSLKSGVDFTCPEGKQLTQIEESWLGPVADAVWKACAAFAPTLENWSREEHDQRDGNYTVKGVNIVVHW